MNVDLIVKNISQLVTCKGCVPKKGKDLLELGIIEHGALAVLDGHFIGVGFEGDILKNFSSNVVVDVNGCTVLPGFVDSHTHLVFGGDRSKEFEMRLQGTSYEEIMAKGGGILSTVKATRALSNESLFDQSSKRMKAMIASGTTTFEIKSGYGLDLKTELKMLKVSRDLGEMYGANVKTTFLGAHSLPDDLSKEAFINLVKGEMLQACKPYSDFIDVFCDKGAFTNDETEDIVWDSGLPIRLHVDELADTGGAHLAARLGAISADHLICSSEDGFKALADSGTVCTFLPGTSFFLGKPFAKARHAIELGCIVAIASDRNPGSCTIQTMDFVIGLACTKLGLTPAEAINSATINAAYSLRLQNEVGSIEIGKRADFVVLDVSSYTMIPYELQISHVNRVFLSGKEAKWQD